MNCGPKGPSKYKVDVVNALADELLKFAESEPLPFLFKFATDHKMDAGEFTNNPAFSQNSGFSQAKKIAAQMLEYKLFIAGATEKINTTMAIFGLKNVAGWRDSPVIDQSVHHHFTLAQIIKDSVNGRTNTKAKSKMDRRLQTEPAPMGSQSLGDLEII